MRVLEALRRETGGGRFVPEIDGLRFVAIGTVLLFHLLVDLAIRLPATYTQPEGSLLGLVARHGFRGVELFFIISGFVLSLPFASHWLRGTPAVPLGAYFLRRLTRLEPPYLLCLLALFALRASLQKSSAGELLPHLLAGFVYQHNLWFGAESPINKVTWSLEIEIQFYVLVPLLSRLFAVRSKAARRALLVALCAASAAGSSHWLAVGDLAWLSLARFLHFFLLGFLLADVYLLDWRERPAQTLAWDLAPLLGWPLLYWLWERFPPPGPGGHEPLPTALVFPLVAFLLNVAAFRGRFTNRLLTLPWITALGGMCYSIYLWHNPLFGGLIALTGGRPLLDAGWTARVSVQGLLVLAPTLALCAVYFVLVEKPCMRRDWPQRLRARLFGAARSA